jgi:hypothetical protein
MAMVLLILLTGLAVSDTEAIKTNAEHLSRFTHKTYLWNGKHPSSVVHFVEKWPKYSFLRPFVEYIKSKIIKYHTRKGFMSFQTRVQHCF